MNFVDDMGKENRANAICDRWKYDLVWRFSFMDSEHCLRDVKTVSKPKRSDQNIQISYIGMKAKAGMNVKLKKVASSQETF